MDLREAKAMCEASGLREGTSEFARCAVSGYEQAQAGHETARTRAREGGVQKLDRPQASAPGQPVLCQTRGLIIVCR